MKQKNDPKAIPKTPVDIKQKGKNPKNQPNIEEEKQEPEVKEEGPKCIERFIHVTTYSDANSLKIIKELFEEINQKAFNLRSVKEIYTKNLSEEEKNNTELDYITGVQLIDKDIRITILEGLTGKGISLVKERLPRTQMNSETFKIFCDSNILFEKRAYSIFDLNLKYIKLRETLKHILTTFGIYCKANKYREIYDTFMNYGSILKCDTLKDINDQKLFPDANNILLLERKYADILSDEDMTGITQKKKKKQRMSVAEIMEKLPNKSDTGTFYSATSDKTLKEQKSATNLRANSASESSAGKKEVSKSFLEQSLGQGGNVSQGQISSDSKRMRLKPPVDSKNQSYEERLSSRRKESYLETQDRNINYIKTMKRKINPDGHFCRPDSGQHEKDEVYLYSQSRKCSYVKWVEDKKNQYIKDKNNFYTYSMMGLNLSFPLITNRNQEYLDYKANQAKWYAKKDFNRYSQPTRDKYFFPKINNEL